jgi:hypothetical protein
MSMVLTKIYSLDIQIERLEKLISLLKAKDSIQGKIEILSSLPEVLSFLSDNPLFEKIFSRLDVKEVFAVFSVLAIGQGPIVFLGMDERQASTEKFNKCLEMLLAVEEFYDLLGGIIGYQLYVLKLILSKQPLTTKVTSIEKPVGLDISHYDRFVRTLIRKGIEGLPRMSEMYPVGGAGDRLDLKDPQTGQPLPAAQLMIQGNTLLEGLLRDLQAREYVYFRLNGIQLLTPVALMTSAEKDNSHRIKEICKKAQWFGRPQESFFFFEQPLVPVITVEGNWAMNEILTPFLKPGGHGVIWKLACDKGVFDWLESFRREKMLIRQINNPIAGVDYGLTAFTGVGLIQNKIFGFASSPRLVNSPEGMNVILQSYHDDKMDCCLTNIEYTDFKKRGIQDEPESTGSKFSKYPSNTNILFADIGFIKDFAKQHPLPGMILNMKNKAPALDPDGTVREVQGGRLETTMQNLADDIIDTFSVPFEKKDVSKLRTYITFNDRRKTISVTKAGYAPGNEINGTPEGFLYDVLMNCRELLTDYCRMRTPSVPNEEEFIKNGPSFLFSYHPALGPMFSIIAQKIRGGVLTHGAELQLEIAEIDIEELYLAGSLQIRAENVVGSVDELGILQYGQKQGRCVLKNVAVRNKGINFSAKNCYWSHTIQRTESLQIILHGNAEFEACDVELAGNLVIEVPDGHKMVVHSSEKQVVYTLSPIEKSSWHWSYQFDEWDNVKLSRKVF